MNESKKYIFWIDLVRVICMMWIVFIWHLKDYLPGEYQMFGSILKVSQWITVTALFAFTLLSGYSMAKYNFQSFKDVLSFYKKRLIRFYPLYLIAILCFWCFGWYSSVTVIKCMTGIALFFNEAPLTLWYMCMLMFFYMITPIINWKYGSYKINVAIYIFVILLFGLLSKLDVTHGNMALYTPAYMAGLFMGKNINLQSVDFSSFWAKAIKVLAYSSFCIYLFHRIIFVMVANMYNHTWVVDKVLIQMDISCAVIVVVCTCVLTYGIQFVYDLCVRKCM